ncbi:MAG: oligosaccharide flippase family protein [Siculibacillus sp.]|nr:oligosaccharide flippase family protein [Siculibacillus sp.]
MRFLPLSPKSLIERLLPAGPARRLADALDRISPPGSSREAATTGHIAVSAFAARVVSAGLAYVSQMLLARWMGGFEYGIFVVVWTLVITFGVVFAFGLEQSVVTLLRKYSHDGDHGAARGLILVARLYTFVVSGLIAAAGCALLWARPDLVADYRLVPIFVAAVCLPIYTVAEIQDGIALAQGWTDLALLPTFLARPATILLLMTLAFALGFEMTAVAACWAAVIATWTATLAQSVALGRRLAATLPPAPRRYEFGSWVRTSAPMFLVDSFLVLLNSIDILLVGRFAEPDRVGIYFATVKTLALVHFVHYAAKVASAKRFASLWHADARDELAEFVGRMVKWTFWASVVMSIGVLAVGRPLLSLFGPGFTEGFPILFVLVVGVLARSSVGPAETLLSMAGQQTSSAFVYGLTLAVSLLLNSILVPIYGIWGAAVGTTVAMVFESIVLAVVVRRRLGLDVFFPAPAGRASSRD